MADSFTVTARQEGRVGVLTTEGYINNSGAEEIAEVCGQLRETGAHSFLLNLEHSRIINSVGISILIEMIESVNQSDGRIGFCCVTPTIEKTFQIMGLLQGSSVYPDEQKGIQALNG